MDDFNKQFDPFNSGAMPQATPQPEPQVQPQFPQANEMGQPMDQSFQIQDPMPSMMQNTQPQTPQVPSVENAFQPQFQEPSFQQLATSSSQDFNASFAAPVQEKKSEEKSSNVCGVISLILAILGVVGVLFVVTAPLGIILLILAFIFGLIGLFKKPRGKAITGFLISGLSLGAMAAFVYYIVSLLYNPVMNLSERFTVEMKPRIEAMMLEENISKFTEDEFGDYLETHLEEKFETFAKKIEESQEIEGIGKFSEIDTKEEIQKVIDFILNALMDTALEVMDEFATEKEISFDGIEKKQALKGIVTNEDDDEDNEEDEDNDEFDEDDEDFDEEDDESNDEEDNEEDEDNDEFDEDDEDFDEEDDESNDEEDNEEDENEEDSDEEHGTTPDDEDEEEDIDEEDMDEDLSDEEDFDDTEDEDFDDEIDEDDYEDEEFDDLDNETEEDSEE